MDVPAYGMPDGEGLSAAVLDRSYPDVAPGWEQEVYAPRAARVTEVGTWGSAADPLTLKGARRVEEVPAVRGDLKTAARLAYLEGTVLRIPAPARTYDVRVTLRGRSEESGRWVAYVNDEASACFDVPATGCVSVAFTVPLTKRDIDLMLVPQGPYDDGEAAKGEIDLVALAAAPVETRRHPVPHIWICSDSTAQTYFPSERPQSGWGEWLHTYLHRDGRSQAQHDDGGSTPQAMRFDGSGPTIRNRALGARSARSYIAEGRFARVLEGLAPGDIVLVQWGINDASSDRPMRYVPLEEYGNWLERYVVSVRDRGARAVLVTPPPQYQPTPLMDLSAIEAYAQATRACAARLEIPCIDVRSLGQRALEELPEGNRSAWYLQVPAQQWPSHPDGITDPVHLSQVGASACARIIARELSKLFDDIAFYGGKAEAPGAPEGLSARGTRGITGLETDLAWSAAPDAEYWTVEKRSAETGVLLNRIVTLQPRLHDLSLPGQGRHVRYGVRSWCGSNGSAAVNVDVSLPEADDRCPYINAIPVHDPTAPSPSL